MFELVTVGFYNRLFLCCILYNAVRRALYVWYC